MGKFIYTFVSSAYFVDERWGHGAPRKGVQRMAAVAHKYDIPVTWLVDSHSAKELSDIINTYHEQNNDDIGLMLTHPPTEYESLRKLVVAEKGELQKLFPWAGVNVAGWGYRSNVMVKVLEDLDFDGLWGYCWEQIEADNITDRGCPWGFFYVARDCYKIPPINYSGKIVGVEWTMRDLNKGFYSGVPWLYSTDPNDVARGKICSAKDIQYWKGLFENYYRNLDHNDYILFAQHQEAHEMEHSAVCHAYTEKDIREAEAIMDKFFSYLKEHKDVVFASLSEAVYLYKSSNKDTMPSLMLCEDVPTKPYNFQYAAGTAVGPWPLSLFYYDKDCQMVFVEGKFEPCLLRNYWKCRDSEDPFYYSQDSLPRYKITTKEHNALFFFQEAKDVLRLDFRIDVPDEMPYGFTLWYDFSTWQVAQHSPSLSSQTLEKKVFFLRLNLKEGTNLVWVKLEKA